MTLKNLLLCLSMTTALGLTACGDKDNTSDDRIQETCEDYCAQRHVCDDEVDTNECTVECIDGVNDCQADEQEAVLDDLESCATESCDDIGECTLGAQLQCTFGI